MNNEFYTALELLEKERGIPKEYMLERIEAALIRAFKGEFRSDSGSQPDVRVEFDTEKRTVRMFRRMTVVDIVEDDATQISLEDAKKISKEYLPGDVVETEISPSKFGRIPAQTAKQVIIQGIREHERGMLIKEYEDKKEEIVEERKAQLYQDTCEDWREEADIKEHDSVWKKIDFNDLSVTIKQSSEEPYADAVQTDDQAEAQESAEETE